MRIGILRFPGTCDDRDTAFAVGAIGHDPVSLWHGDADLQGADAVIVPGGFSYGDYLRAGAIARFSPVMTSVRAFAEDGGRVLGICNGFQVLCEAGLLPGALTRNVGLRFLHTNQALCWEPSGQIITIPLKNGEGRYIHPGPEELIESGQVLLRYCNAEGQVDEAHNPNGSVAGIAGVTNVAGNVAGLMPHPEHAVDSLLGGIDGRAFLLDRLIGASIPA